MTESVYVIILNYNGYDDTIECVKSVEDSDYPNKKIIVVDNASKDESYDVLSKSLNKNVVLLKSDVNIGYAGGNNIGIKYALEDGADYICVLNNDTIVKSDMLTKCVEELKKDETIAFIGPAIMEFNEDVVQSTGGDVNIKIGEVTLNNHGTHLNELSDKLECDYIGGACMVFKASIIKNLGMIPENYFLFFEETEWCYRAKRRGLKNVCITTTSLRHKGSASIDVIQGLHGYLMERNRVVFVKRNIGNVGMFLLYLVYQFMLDVYRAIFKDKAYWKYINYHFDGILGKVDYKSFPFIVIKDN